MANHPFKKWEITIMEIQDKDKILYKVTRRLAEMGVAETKIFHSKYEAQAQFEEWLK